MAAVVVKASVYGQPLARRVSFRDAHTGLARKQDRDDDNDLIELATTADLHECLDYFSTDPSLSSSSSSYSLSKPVACITVKLELIVEYDGPSLSETDAASSVWSAAPSSWRRGGAAPASRASSFGAEREGVLRRWRMQQQEATVDAEEEDAASDDWLRRPAFAIAVGSRTPIDSASSSASASAIDADNEQDWDTRTVSSISFAPGPLSHSHPDLSARRPTQRSEDALYPNFAPPPRWLSTLGPAAHPPYPLPFSFTPYSAPKLPIVPSEHDCALPLAHHQAPLFAAQTSYFGRPSSAHSLPSDFSGLDLEEGPSPSQSLRERVQDLFAPSSDEESLHGRAGGGAGDPLLGREVQTASLFAPARKAESSYTVTDSDSDSDSLPLPPFPSKTSTLRARPRNLVLAGEYWCAECGRKIEGARYSCAVCEGFDLCRECELNPPSRSSRRPRGPETIPLTHGPSHILLKIPISLSSSSSSSALVSARELASSLSHSAPLPPPPSEGSYLQEGDLTSYWSWWERWYAQGQVPAGSREREEEVSKHSWSGIEGRTSAGGVGGAGGGGDKRKEEHTYPPKPPASPAPPALPAHPSLSSSAIVRPSTFTRFSSPHFTHFALASHGVRCRNCEEMIVASHNSTGGGGGGGGGEQGVRWLCGNCPTVPSYDLCPTCEPLSTRIHDPTHTFLRLTHPLRRSLPSISQGLLPLLCLPPTSDSQEDRKDEEVVHRTVICDACGVRIKGAWMRCCHCPTSYDLCRPCLLSSAPIAAGHNPSHVFAALKRPVDLDLLKSVTRITSRRPRGLVEWDLYA
uniref:BY PROTMAP: gi/472583630/gb/EMS21263.1/ zinc finger, ZZ-type protein [Rhodosporidium toruloides NP11] n=1 Tax=Rhodotorula toruloides TaxID=5286 RepID=A0A0K3C4G3_RHOTO